MNDSTAVILKTEFDYTKPALIIETNWYFVAGIICLIVLYIIYQKKIKAKLQNIFVQETSFEINTGLFKYNQKIKRSYQNLYVAHRIYIELVTRKAAIPIDVDKDVLVEVYNSWYSMFKTIREEIKNLPGDYLVDNESTKKLVDLTIEILNDGLRAHLTTYQAEFRKWYDKELKKEIDSDISPQEIQKRYSKFKELTASMIEVNKTLEAYCDQLKKLIDDK
ncbi:MAG: hypothetical protein AUJ98_05410 [Bacteroidetes bacterium CG2_30_33_31]|nr:MAG: hypothetical protein AUJ98_05410 [Bacteroidetes bacterium CG2_30_33_31]